MTAMLVVADAERSKNTICLAVSVAAKKKGIKNRCRLGDVPTNMGIIIAPPRMQLYIDYAAEIYGVFLKYFAPEDIYVYSIDESFIDVTPYLSLYGLPPKDLAKKVIDDIKETVGTLSTCGIGTNLYLAKVALDIIEETDSGRNVVGRAAVPLLLPDQRKQAEQGTWYYAKHIELPETEGAQ